MDVTNVTREDGVLIDFDIDSTFVRGRMFSIPAALIN